MDTCHTHTHTHTRTHTHVRAHTHTHAHTHTYAHRRPAMSTREDDDDDHMSDVHDDGDDDNGDDDDDDDDEGDDGDDDEGDNDANYNVLLADWVQSTITELQPDVAISQRACTALEKAGREFLEECFKAASAVAASKRRLTVKPSDMQTAVHALRVRDSNSAIQSFREEKRARLRAHADAEARAKIRDASGAAKRPV